MRRAAVSMTAVLEHLCKERILVSWVFLVHKRCEGRELHTAALGGKGPRHSSRTSSLRLRACRHHGLLALCINEVVASLWRALDRIINRCRGAGAGCLTVTSGGFADDVALGWDTPPLTEKVRTKWAGEQRQGRLETLKMNCRENFKIA